MQPRAAVMHRCLQCSSSRDRGQDPQLKSSSLMEEGFPAEALEETYLGEALLRRLLARSFTTGLIGQLAWTTESWGSSLWALSGGQCEEDQSSPWKWLFFPFP